MTEHEIALKLAEILQRFLDMVHERLPRAPLGFCYYDGADAHGVRSPLVEFELGENSEALCLMYHVTKRGERVQVSGDFGFSTTVLASMPTLAISASAAPDEMAAVLESAREFAFALVDLTVTEIARSLPR